MSGSLKDEVLVMKILANAHRIRILETISRADKELCVSEIAEAVGISHSLTSHFLSYLSAHRVVVGHRMGQTICYLPAKNAFANKVFTIMKILTQ